MKMLFRFHCFLNEICVAHYKCELTLLIAIQSLLKLTRKTLTTHTEHLKRHRDDDNKQRITKND